MTWSLSASGHTETKDDERAILDALRDGVKNLPEGQIGNASFYGQHHGEVNLMEPAPDEEPDKAKTATATTPTTSTPAKHSER
jgi:hypothetical protein